MTTQPSTRQEQILTLLLNSIAGMSIDEMATELQISRNALKQHLLALEKQQLVQEASLNSTGGRPARSYSLTKQGVNRFPKQYAWFSELLIEELTQRMGEEAINRMMWDMGVKLAHSLSGKFASKNPAEKQTALVELMQELGYFANLEQHEQHTSIKAVNCVFHDLAQKHTALCQFDVALISTLLDQPIEQTECMAKQGCVCRFRIGHIFAV